jgi:hypothetical protein
VALLILGPPHPPAPTCIIQSDVIHGGGQASRKFKVILINTIALDSGHRFYFGTKLSSLTARERAELHVVIRESCMLRTALDSLEEVS